VSNTRAAHKANYFADELLSVLFKYLNLPQSHSNCIANNLLYIPI